MTEPQPHKPTETEIFNARRKRRSIALGLLLAAIVLIFYALTVVKFGPAILVRDL